MAYVACMALHLVLCLLPDANPCCRMSSWTRLIARRMAHAKLKSEQPKAAATAAGGSSTAARSGSSASLQAAKAAKAAAGGGSSRTWSAWLWGSSSSGSSSTAAAGSSAGGAEGSSPAAAVAAPGAVVVGAGADADGSLTAEEWKKLEELLGGQVGLRARGLRLSLHSVPDAVLGYGVHMSQRT